MGGLIHIVWPGLDPILDEPLETIVTVGNRHHLRRTAVIDKALDVKPLKAERLRLGEDDPPGLGGL